MQTRTLGWTEVKLTTVGLGTWAIGGGNWEFAWGPQNDQESIETIHQALDMGINWIDTAAVYGLGHSEEIVGRAIKGMKERPFIATKCGRVWDDQGRITGNLTRESVRREAENSLRRLGVEVIDLFQIHWPDPDYQIEEGWATIADLIKEGKIRYGGVSNFNVEQLKRIQKIHPVASLQPPYSMLRREAEKELFPYCAEQHIGVIVYSPMQKGLLTGKITPERVKNFAPDDHRRNDSMFQEPQLSSNLKLVEKLRSIAEKEGRSVAQLAIAWVLRRPEVTAAIVGARRPDQIKETAPAGDWSLSPQIIEAIEGWLKEL
ncbi:MAG: hypothetical protein PWP04_748 [Candidatus Atribacteria bacterium]|nr:hypothetical protein [Candidatus Atribacteria bacterium]